MQWQSHKEPTRRNIAEHHLFIIELHLAVHMVQLRCLCRKRVCVRGGHHAGEQEELPEDIRVMLSEYAKMSKAASAAYGPALEPTFKHFTVHFGFDIAESFDALWITEEFTHVFDSVDGSLTAPTKLFSVRSSWFD